MDQVYHEAVCRFQLDDVVKLNAPGLMQHTYKIEEIMLLQFVRANHMEFRFRLSNQATGEQLSNWMPYHLMGDIVMYGNGKKPQNTEEAST